jgi:hypothetical protein
MAKLVRSASNVKVNGNTFRRMIRESHSRIMDGHIVGFLFPLKTPGAGLEFEYYRVLKFHRGGPVLQHVPSPLGRSAGMVDHSKAKALTRWDIIEMADRQRSCLRML